MAHEECNNMSARCVRRTTSSRQSAVVLHWNKQQTAVGINMSTLSTDSTVINMWQSYQHSLKVHQFCCSTHAMSSSANKSVVYHSQSGDDGVSLSQYYHLQVIVSAAITIKRPILRISSAFEYWFIQNFVQHILSKKDIQYNKVLHDSVNLMGKTAEISHRQSLVLYNKKVSITVWTGCLHAAGLFHL